MIKIGDYPVFDMHVHLRNRIAEHTKLLKSCGIDIVVYMANPKPPFGPLDSREKIIASLKRKRHCLAIPVSAITKGLAGKELVEINEIRDLVPAFSDDGQLLRDMGLLRAAFEQKIPIWAHCSPSFEEGLEDPWLETKYAEQHITVCADTGGILHIQHVSQRTTVELVRATKKQGVNVTAETGPQYCFFPRGGLETKVNPPLNTKKDREAIKEGLADGTIDIIISDYAPEEERKTGIAIPEAFLILCYGLILEGVLTETQLKDKLFTNPKRIIESGGYKLNLEKEEKDGKVVPSDQK